MLYSISLAFFEVMNWIFLNYSIFADFPICTNYFQISTQKERDADK